MGLASGHVMALSGVAVGHHDVSIRRRGIPLVPAWLGGRLGAG
jgi:hypothetical protein